MRSRLLGVDYGSVRIGLAVSDADRKIASPLATYERRGPEADARYFQDLIEREEIGRIVVGLPVHLDGGEGRKAAEARAASVAFVARRSTDFRGGTSGVVADGFL